MKKLSDYRIKEENGEITIEKETNIYVFGFKKREKKFVPTDFKGKCCLDMDFSNKVGEYPSVEAAKAQIIKWCEEPKYHYVVADYGIKELPNFAIGKKRYKIQSVPQMDIPYSVGMKALTRDYGVYFIFPFDEIAKTEQQMKDEITEQECVDAIKRQVDEIFSLPLTFEEKNLELQRENARLKGIIETLIAKKK